MTLLSTGRWANRLTTGSIRMNRVLNEPDQKSTHIEICKKISTQPSSNPWWAELTREFQPISNIHHSLNGILKKGLCCKNWRASKDAISY